MNFYCHPESLEKHLLEARAEDAQAIHELADGVRLGIRFKPPAMEQYESSVLASNKFIIGMMPIVRGMQRWSNLTVGELAALP